VEDKIGGGVQSRVDRNREGITIRQIRLPISENRWIREGNEEIQLEQKKKKKNSE
jgi:hypothetical protein